MRKKESPSSVSGKLLKNKSEMERSRKSSSVGGQFTERSVQGVNQQVVMQEAIQKASCLIELLNRENTQCRQLIEDLNEQVQQLKLQKQEIQRFNAQAEQKLELCELEKEKLLRENEELLFQLQKIRMQEDLVSKDKLLQSRQKNKQLHQKIAYLSQNSTKLTSELQTLKKEYNSLENQNQYLLRQLQKSELKENAIVSNISLKQNQFNQKLNTLDRAKEAFARRTEELKHHTLQLQKQMQQLRKEKYDLQIVAQESMSTLDALTQKIQTYRYLQQKIHTLYEKVRLSNQQKPRQFRDRTSSQMSLKQKLEQVQILLGYRFQHIQTLINHILTKVEKPDWRLNLRHLKETHSLVQRLNTYLTELSTNNL